MKFINGVEVYVKCSACGKMERAPTSRCCCWNDSHLGKPEGWYFETDDYDGVIAIYCDECKLPIIAKLPCLHYHFKNGICVDCGEGFRTEQ